MKKLSLLFLLIAAIPFIAVSCSDENSLPQVDYYCTFSGAALDTVTGTLYVVQGDTLRIDSVDVVNHESDKAAAITGADYYWDYNYLGSSLLPPFAFNIATTDMTPVGNHLLTIRTGVVAVDKELATGIINYQVTVVPDSTAIPL